MIIQKYKCFKRNIFCARKIHEEFIGFDLYILYNFHHNAQGKKLNSKISNKLANKNLQEIETMK